MVKYNSGSVNPIRIVASHTDRDVRLELTDFDVDPFDPNTVPALETPVPPAERRPGGLGLNLVRSMVDKLTYEYDDRNLRVTARKRLK